MKRQWMPGIIMVLSLLVWSAPAFAVELITNGDFEDGSGNPDDSGWVFGGRNYHQVIGHPGDHKGFLGSPSGDHGDYLSELGNSFAYTDIFVPDDATDLVLRFEGKLVTFDTLAFDYARVAFADLENNILENVIGPFNTNMARGHHKNFSGWHPLTYHLIGDYRGEMIRLGFLVHQGGDELWPTRLKFRNISLSADIPPPPPTIPEPSSSLLLGLGLAGATMAKRRRGTRASP